MFKILDNVLDYKRIIKNLCIDENDIYDSDK